MARMAHGNIGTPCLVYVCFSITNKPNCYISSAVWRYILLRLDFFITCSTGNVAEPGSLIHGPDPCGVPTSESKSLIEITWRVKTKSTNCGHQIQTSLIEPLSRHISPFVDPLACWHPKSRCKRKIDSDLNAMNNIIAQLCLQWF
jgi:hypothetical protein